MCGAAGSLTRRFANVRVAAGEGKTIDRPAPVRYTVLFFFFTMDGFVAGLR